MVVMMSKSPYPSRVKVKRVVILQEYVPQYREALFDGLRVRANQDGYELIVAAGKPTGPQARRRDATLPVGSVALRQFSFSLANRRVTIRLVPGGLRSADLTIIEHARRNIDVYSLLLPRGWRRHRLALWGHGKDFVQEVSRFRRHLHRLLARRADWYFAYTPAGAVAVEDAGLPGERITVLWNTVDTEAMRNDSVSLSDSELDRFRVANELVGMTAVFLGGLDASKRIDFLLEAGTLAHSLDSNFRLLVVGDGALRDVVVSAAADADWLQYLGPLQGREKVTALIASDVIAMPGRVGLVTVDSFVTRTPIITTDHPGHAPEFDYLEDGGNALVVPDDPKRYALALIQVLQDRERLDHLRMGCEQSVGGLSMDEMIERMWSGIRQAID